MSGYLGPGVPYAVFATQGALDIYVDDANGVDTNPGTQALPLKTITAAYAMVPLTVNHLVRIFVAPHAGAGYTFPQLAWRLLNEHVWLIGTGFTELITPAQAAAGSSNQLVVTGGGLGVDAYRGKTIEILSGAAIGDKRTIRNNTAANLVPVTFFSAAVANGDSYRVVEPSTILDGPASDHLFAVGVGAGNGDPRNDAPPSTKGLWLENLRIDLSDDLATANAMVYFMGCEIRSSGGTRRLFGDNGVSDWKWGIELATSVPSAVARGAMSTTSYRGYGVFSDGILLPIKLTMSGYVVSSGFTCFGGRYELLGGSVAGFLRANGGSNGTCVISCSLVDDNGPAFLVSSTSDVVRALFDGALIRATLIDVTSTVGAGVLASQGGVVEMSDDAIVNATGAGLKATLGGRVAFNAGMTLNAGGNDTEAGNAPVAQAFATYAVAGDFIAETPGDGSVVQRVA